MKLTAALFAFATLLQGGAAVQWEQYYYGDCTGTVENSGSEVLNRDCVPQQGASVRFTASGGVGCEIAIHGDDTCSDALFVYGDGCYTFGGTKRSFSVICGGGG